MNGEPTGALRVLSIAEWDSYTAELAGGNLAYLVEHMGDMYVPGRLIVIAANESESTRLVLFKKGTFEGMELAGKVFCVSMDPVLGASEAVADSFFALIESFASDPAGFLSRIGCAYVAFGTDGMYGDPANRYMPDCGDSLETKDTTGDVRHFSIGDDKTAPSKGPENRGASPDEPLLPFMR